MMSHSKHVPIQDEESLERSVDNQVAKKSDDKSFVTELKKITDEETSKKFRWKGLVNSLHDDDISLAFVAASVIAVFMDPFFFYIPLVDVQNLCIRTDKTLQIVALISRSVADFLFLWHMIDQFRKAVKHFREAGGEIFLRAGQTTSNLKPLRERDSKISDYKKVKASIKFRKKLWLCTIDFLAVLPIPQLLVVFFFTREGSYGFSNNRMGWNLLLILQYGPRTYIILQMLGKLKEHSPKWFISGLYIFTCIIAGNILGGFWYFNAIQKQLMCWYRASCSSGSGCRITYCGNDSYSDGYSIGTRTIINRNCSLNGGAFDYAMFSDGLKSGYMERQVTGGKLSYFIWLGLKYLSTNGSELKTAYNLWENCFAILVAIMGLVLFAYLIGHMQQFLQSMAEKEEVSNKIRKKKQEWKKRGHVVPKEVWKQIWPWMQYKLEKDDDADIEFLDCLPEFVQNYLRKEMLEKVLEPERFQKLKLVEMAAKASEDKEWLENNIYTYLKTVSYPQKEFIFRVGEPLDSMLYIVNGTVITYTPGPTGSQSIKAFGYDHVYGDKLIMSWASTPNTLANTVDSLGNLPFSTKNVRCHTKVEGFVLTAEDLKTLLHKLEKYPAADNE